MTRGGLFVGLALLGIALVGTAATSSPDMLPVSLPVQTQSFDVQLQPLETADLPEPEYLQNTVQVMSWNIRHGADDLGRVDLDRVVDRLRNWAPDIIGLQEVDRFWKRSGLTDQPQYIATELGYDYAFGANLQRLKGQYGNVLLSRWPILEQKNYPLPSTREPRGVLWGRVKTPWGELNVLVTHLGLSRSERNRQLAAIEELVDDLSDPVVLLGDFNAEDEATFAKLTEVIKTAGLATFPARQPTYSIDAVFVSPELTVDDREAIEDFTSDHRPVMVKLTWGR